MEDDDSKQLAPPEEPLSEEQTNAALAALQEVAAADVEEKDTQPKNSTLGKKRKAPKDDDSEGASKKRGPTRVSWDDRMQMLKDYKNEFGDLLIPIRFKRNPSLGKFVHNTREQYKIFHKRTPADYKKKCSLTAERISQLDEIGFVWSTERTKRQNEDWEQRLEQLKDYKKEHGDCLVPHGYSKDASFAEWIHRQRTTYATHIKEGRKNKMVEERMKKLEDLGFNFRVHVDKWSEHYEQLKDYRKQHGDCLVPTHFSSNPRLGRWVHTQRHQRRLMMKGKKSSMTEDRIKLLDDLDFNWEVRPSLERPRASWSQRFEELRDFHEKNGNFLVDGNTHPQLYGWCQEQKQRLENIDKLGKDASKRMGPDRVRALLEIGFAKDAQLGERPSPSSTSKDARSTESGEQNKRVENVPIDPVKHEVVSNVTLV